MTKSVKTVKKERKKWVDLHCHTTVSTGLMTVDKLLDKAIDSHEGVLAVTDHNAFAAYETKEIRRRDRSVTLLPGCEFSAVYESAGLDKKKEIHILGIFPLGVSEGPREFLSSINLDGYADAAIAMLNEQGIPTSREAVQAANPDCRQFLASNFCRYLLAGGYCSSISEAMDRYMGRFSEHCIPYLSVIDYHSVEDTVAMIVKNKGIPILAHPLVYHLDPPQLKELIHVFYDAAGGSPAGFETYYSKYGPEEIALLQGLAGEFDRVHGKHLYLTAGSDIKRKEQELAKGRIEDWENLLGAFMEKQK